MPTSRLYGAFFPYSVVVLAVAVVVVVVVLLLVAISIFLLGPCSLVSHERATQRPDGCTYPRRVVSFICVRFSFVRLPTA